MALEQRIVSALQAVAADIKALFSLLAGKVDKASGKGLSTEDYSSAEKVKLRDIAAYATANSSDTWLRDRNNHVGTQAISTVNALQASLDSKLATTGGSMTGTINMVSAPTSKIWLYSTTYLFGDGVYAGFMVNGEYKLRFRSDLGQLAVFGDLLGAGAKLRADGVYSETTAEAPNVVVAASGYLKRSTSSIKYKTAIEDVDPEMMQRVIENTRPIWYRSTCPNDRRDFSWWGIAAEEIAEVDPRLVNWQHPLTEVVELEGVPEKRDENGEIIQQEIKEIRTMRPDTSQPLQAEGVMYERLVVPLLWHAQQMRARVETLELQLSDALRRLAALEGGK